MTPKISDSVNNNTPGRQTIARDGAVLPFPQGRARYAVQWITPVLHWTYRETKTSSYAFFSAVGVVCLGPIDEACRLIVNGKTYWTINEHRDQNPSGYCSWTIPKETPERMRVWFGTTTQSGIGTYAQSLIRNAGHPESGKSHPDYYRQVIIAVQDMEAGAASSGQTPPLPAVEMEVYRRSTLAYSFGHVPHGTNPVAAIYDILTDPIAGLGLGSDRVDSTHWSTKVGELWTNGVAGAKGEDICISIPMAEQKEAGDYISDALQYFGGHLRMNNGKIEIGWQPNDGSTVSSSGLRELSQQDMTAEPDIQSSGIDDMVTHVSVTGLDWLGGAGVGGNVEAPLSECTEVAQVPYAREIIGEPRTEKLNRPFLCTREQIRQYAAAMAAARARPSYKGSIRVRREKATHPDSSTPLRPGDRFNLDYAPRELDIVCRITERIETTDKTEVTLKFESERGATPQAYVPPLDEVADRTQGDPGDILYSVIVEATRELELDDDPTVIVLAERPDTSTASHRLHFAQTDSWPGEEILESNRWAVSGVMDAAADSDDPTISVSITAAEVDRLESQGGTAQANDTLLCYAGGEWLSVGTITPEGSGLYTVAVLRGRLGSTAASIADESRVFFVYRSELVRVAHRDFRNVGSPYNSTTATKYFKLQSFTGTVDGDIPETATAIQFDDRAPDEPSGLTAYPEVGAVSFTCENPSDSDLARIEFWVRTTADTPEDGDAPDFTVLAAPGVTLSSCRVTGLSASATRYGYARAVDVDGYKSDIVGPASASAVATPQDGADGDDGDDGLARDRWYTRSRTQPDTPTGDDPGITWSQSIPADNGLPLWASEVWRDSDGDAVGSWSEPQRISGHISFYQNSAPTTSTDDLAEGDLWFDTDNGMKGHRWENPGSGYQWVAKLFGTAAFDSIDAGVISGGIISAAISITSPTILGDGIYIGSAVGIRMEDDESVLTITGGNDNDVSNGAQIDMVGSSHADSGIAGALVLSAGDGAYGGINFMTGNGGTVNGRTVGVLRGKITKAGDWEVYGDLDVDGTVTAPAFNTTP